jgi:hypothetical protein
MSTSCCFNNNSQQPVKYCGKCSDVPYICAFITDQAVCDSSKFNKYCKWKDDFCYTKVDGPPFLTDTPQNNCDANTSDVCYIKDTFPFVKFIDAHGQISTTRPNVPAPVPAPVQVPIQAPASTTPTATTSSTVASPPLSQPIVMTREQKIFILVTGIALICIFLAILIGSLF